MSYRAEMGQRNNHSAYTGDYRASDYRASPCVDSRLFVGRSPSSPLGLLGRVSASPSSPSVAFRCDTPYFILAGPRSPLSPLVFPCPSSLSPPQFIGPRPPPPQLTIPSEHKKVAFSKAISSFDRSKSLLSREISDNSKKAFAELFCFFDKLENCILSLCGDEKEAFDGVLHSLLAIVLKYKGKSNAFDVKQLDLLIEDCKFFFMVVGGEIKRTESAENRVDIHGKIERLLFECFKGGFYGPLLLLESKNIPIVMRKKVGFSCMEQAWLDNQMDLFERLIQELKKDPTFSANFFPSVVSKLILLGKEKEAVDHFIEFFERGNKTQFAISFFKEGLECALRQAKRSDLNAPVFGLDLDHSKDKKISNLRTHMIPDQNDYIVFLQAKLAFLRGVPYETHLNAVENWNVYMEEGEFFAVYTGDFDVLNGIRRRYSSFLQEGSSCFDMKCVSKRWRLKMVSARFFLYRELLEPNSVECLNQEYRALIGKAEGGAKFSFCQETENSLSDYKLNQNDFESFCLQHLQFLARQGLLNEARVLAEEYIQFFPEKKRAKLARMQIQLLMTYEHEEKAMDLLQKKLAVNANDGVFFLLKAQLHLNPCSRFFDLHQAGIALDSAEKYTRQILEIYLRQYQLHLIRNKGRIDPKIQMEIRKKIELQMDFHRYSSWCFFSIQNIDSWKEEIDKILGVLERQYLNYQRMEGSVVSSEYYGLFSNSLGVDWINVSEKMTTYTSSEKIACVLFST